MARQPIEIDRDKLRVALRKLDDEHAFYMLNDAIELLPPAMRDKQRRRQPEDFGSGGPLDSLDTRAGRVWRQ